MLVTSRVRAACDRRAGVPGPADGDARAARRDDIGSRGRANRGGRALSARARAVNPIYRDRANAAGRGAICRRLDGLPLAIELAAARVNVLSPAALLARLDEPPAAPDRRRPRRAGTTADHARRDRLELRPALAPEQRLFRRLAVFDGGFDLDAAEAVAAVEPAMDGLDGVTALVEASLLRRAEGPAGDPRYLMLETIREYGLERLAEAGEEAETRDAHAAHYLTLAEQVFPEWGGPRTGYWHARFAADFANVRSAITWFRENDDAASGIRLVTSLQLLWDCHGRIREVKELLEHLLAESPDVSLALRSSALWQIGWSAMVLQDLDEAARYADAALPLARQSGDAETLIEALLTSAAVAGLREDYAEAERYSEEVVTIARMHNRVWRVSSAIHNLGILTFAQGDLVRARALHEEAVAMSRAAGNTFDLTNSLSTLGIVVYEQGDQAAATLLFKEGLDLCRSTEWARSGEGFALIAADLGLAEQAARLYGASEADAMAAGTNPYGLDSSPPDARARHRHDPRHTGRRGVRRGLGGGSRDDHQRSTRSDHGPAVPGRFSGRNRRNHRTLCPPLG